MMLRRGFVSNSSTSSFVCEVCHDGYEEEESFPCEPSIRRCVKKHLFCLDHSYDEFENILDVEYNLTDRHVGENLYDSMYMNVPEDCCPICKLDEIPDSHIIDFLLKYNNFTREKVKNMIRAEHHKPS
jgi:hypothetical protein